MDKVISGFATGLERLTWNSWFNYIFLQDIHTRILGSFSFDFNLALY